MNDNLAREILATQIHQLRNAPAQRAASDEEIADALMPTVCALIAAELRGAADWIPGPEEWHNGSETYEELIARADALDPPDPS